MVNRTSNKRNCEIFRVMVQNQGMMVQTKNKPFVFDEEGRAMGLVLNKLKQEIRNMELERDK